jgi:hypothetical protein
MGMYMNVEKRVLYVKAGKKGTTEVVDAIAARVKDDGLSSVIVASTSGKTAIRIGEVLKGLAEVVSVTEFTYGDDIKKAMKKLKIAPIEKAILPIQDRPAMREALLMFGSGVKAALDVVAVAAEKGLTQDRVIGVAGSERGLDTALVVRPSPPSEFSNPDPKKRMAVLEVVAMPLKG